MKRLTRYWYGASIDIGTIKVCCCIVRASTKLEILGIGHHACLGVKAGVIVDVKAIERSIAAAVESAERNAGQSVSEVCVNISGPEICSKIMEIEGHIRGNIITDGDIISLTRSLDTEDETIHTIPLDYKVDAMQGIIDPRGMIASTLGIKFNVTSVPRAQLSNLVLSLSRCHLDVLGVVASPYASGLAVLTEEERELGVTVIDIGGGTTTLAFFKNGKATGFDFIPIGGHHITKDLAYALGTTITSAERVKTLYGSAITSSSDEKEFVPIPLMNDESLRVDQLPKSNIVNVIKPRVEEILELVKEKTTSQKIVLTGGASQLFGMKESAELILGKMVRIGSPKNHDACFSTAIGLAKFGLEQRKEQKNDESTNSKMSWFVGWLKKKL